MHNLAPVAIFRQGEGRSKAKAPFLGFFFVLRQVRVCSARRHTCNFYGSHSRHVRGHCVSAYFAKVRDSYRPYINLGVICWELSEIFDILVGFFFLSWQCFETLFVCSSITS